MPTVSIIVPNYNHAKFLQERLDSIFSQTFQDFEVILLDDHSDDNSAELLSNYSSHLKVTQLIINESNSGSTFKQWKKGIALATSPFIWIAESDDIADQSFLATLVPVMQDSPNVGVAYCQSQIIDDKSETINSNLKWTSDLSADRWSKPFQLKGKMAIEEYFIYKNIIPNASAVLFRKEVFNRISNSLEEFKFVGDWLAWIQMLSMSDLYYSPLHLNFFRLHSNVTRNRKTPGRRKLYFLEVYSVLSQIPLSTKKREEAFKHIGMKVYKKFGAWYLLNWKGFDLSKKITSFDPQFRWRVLSTLLRGRAR